MSHPTPYPPARTRAALATLAALAVPACHAAVAQETRAVLEPIVATIDARVDAVSSSALTVHWGRVAGARGARVLLAAEPGALPDGPFPDAVELARVGPAESTYRLTGLAPATHVFVRVEVDTPAGTQAHNFHALTAGGPRARLDGPVREVHAVAPDVLEVVMVNGVGAVWEAGPWRVQRRDGRALAVTAVHRHSVPTAQPNYQVGPGGANSGEPVETDHRIYLHLAQPIGPRDVLAIAGPAGVALRLPFSDRYLETPSVQLNQVGYNPRATRRWAYVSGWLGDGGALDLRGFPAQVQVLRVLDDPLAARTDVAATLAVAPRVALDPDTGGAVAQIDLATVPAAEGVVLRIRVPGVGVSYPTQVSERAVFRAFWVAARGLFHNRWGGDLRPLYTDWPRPPDHARVYTGEQANAWEMYPANTPLVGARTLRGGYHDAGDYDQRPSHTVVAQLLMRAYEIQPERFTDRQLALPESGNRVPDLLDEALWGVAGWEQLQEPDGGVRAGVESFRHPDAIQFADQDTLPFWTFARDADVTARAAGLFAQAARLVVPFDPGVSRRLRARAERAFEYARGHGAGAWSMLYATGELLRLTDDTAYKSAFEAAWTALGADALATFSWSQLGLSDYAHDHRVMPDFVLGYVQSGRADAAIVAAVMRYLDQYADAAAQRVLASPLAHRSGRPPAYAVAWGQGVVQGRYLDTVFARLQLGGLTPARRQGYLDAMSLAADYVLGGNPEGMVYMTGLGSRRPEEPLHTDSLVWLARGRPPVPGIPVFGPINELPGAWWYRPGAAAFYPAFGEQPMMRRYGDIRSFVNTNEFSVWETQAPHVEHFALLLGAAQTPPIEWLPGYPRPAFPGANDR